MKGDTNTYFKQITFFLKKKEKIIHIFFNFILLHLNNHQATNYGKIKSKTGKTENTQLSLCSKNGKHAIIVVFQKRKTRNYPCVRKTETRLVARALVAVRKKK